MPTDNNNNNQNQNQNQNQVKTPIDFYLENNLNKALLPFGYKGCFPSFPVNRINLPEVKSSSGDFIYNYFLRDEKTSTLTAADTNVIPSESQEAITNYNTSNINLKRIARYNLIEFQKPSIDSIFDNEGLRTQLKNIIQLNSIDNNDIVNRIICEGTSFNRVISGVELLDTNKEKKLYTVLKSNLMFKNIDISKYSQKEAAEILYNTLNEKGGLAGEDKRLLINAMANIASEGYNIAPTDIPEDVAILNSDPISTQTFSVQFNNLLMQDLLNSSNIISDSIYGDELRALEDFSSDVKDSVLNDPLYAINQFNEIDYSFEIEPIFTYPQLPNNQFVNPEINFVGFLVEKYEVNSDNSKSLISKRFLSGVNSTSLTDINIRYGALYSYKIRTVFSVKVPSTSVNAIGYSENTISIFLFASEGENVNIHCIERIPPPPPHGLTFKFDYRHMMPFIRWQFPLNKQRDIKKFQVFKRLSVREPFTLIAEIDFDDSVVKTIDSVVPTIDTYYRYDKPVLYFLDKYHKEGEKPIYAIGCIDAHGLSSNYSAQVQIERDILTNQVKRTLISREGAPKPYPNMYLEFDAFQDCIKVSGYERMKLFFDPEYYQVLQNKTINGQIQEEDVGLIAIDPNNFRYKFHLINIDNNKDQILNVKIKDASSNVTVSQDYFNTRPASLIGANLSFE